MYIATDNTRKINLMGKIESRVGVLIEKKQRELGRDNFNLHILSHETKLSYSTLMKWAKGQVARADFDTMAVLCEYFDVEPGELLAYVPDDEPE